MAQGIFKAYDFLKEGEINSEVIANFYDKNVADAEWKPILKAAAETCKSKIDAKQMKFLREWNPHRSDSRKTSAVPKRARLQSAFLWSRSM